FIVDQIPAMRVSLEEHLRSQSGVLPHAAAGAWSPAAWQWFLVVVVVQSLCEELAFRGFILSGLRRRFQPWTAVFISSFLFALSHMNVFQFVPHFVAGVVMGFLVVRTGSVLPAMVSHLVFNAMIFGPIISPRT